MTDRNNPLPADAPNAFRSFAELLAACRELYARRLADALGEAVARVDAELQQRRRACTDLADSLKLLEAQYQVRAMARGLAQKFARCFADSYRRRTEADGGAQAAQGGEECLLPAFNLFATHAVEVAPEVLALSRPLEQAAGVELAQLRPRVALLLGRETLDEGNDPFGPAAICEAILGLCAELAGTAENRELVRRMLVEGIAALLPTLFGEAAALLADSRIPAARQDVPGEGTDTASRTAAHAAASTGAPPAAHSTALLDALAALPGGATELVVDGRRYALARTGTARANIPRELLAGGLDRALDDAERIVLDVVATLFEHLFNSVSIPPAMKTLLGRLQLPVLHLALSDHRFFAERNHPARRLLNLLSLAGATWDGELDADSSLFRHADALIARIERESTHTPEVFATCREELETWLAEQERSADARTATLTDRLAQRERQQLARRAAEAAVAETLADASLPTSLREFVGDTWVKVLAHAQLDGGPDGTPWRMALATLQDLVWSVRPKHDAEQRTRLAQLLNALLGGLRNGMARAGTDAALRDAFLAELVKLHAAAVKAGMSAAAAPAPEAAPAEERRPAYRGDSAPEPDADGSMAVDMLSRGDWVELREAGGGVRPVRLTWVSPARTLYLFANRQGQRAVALTREELVRRYTTGEATTASEDTLLERIVDDVLERHENKP